MPEHVCSKCGISKPLTDYHLSRTRPLGIETACKDCRRIARQAYLQRVKGQRPKKTEAEWRAYKARARARVRARDAVNNAIRHGQMTKPDNCGRCGKACIPQGHHHDYSKPLEVEWLCSTCHGLAHSRKSAPDAEKFQALQVKREERGYRPGQNQPVPVLNPDRVRELRRLAAGGEQSVCSQNDTESQSLKSSGSLTVSDGPTWIEPAALRAVLIEYTQWLGRGWFLLTCEMRVDAFLAAHPEGGQDASV